MNKIYSAVRASVVMTCAGVLLSCTAYSQTDVLVCGAASPQTWLDDVQNKLIATGSFSTVTTYNTYSTGTPTVAYLQTFDAVLVYTDYGCMDPVTFGNNLATYIDGGGAVVSCVFANASVLITGNFNTAPYQVCIPNSGQNASPLTLGATLDPCSPIMTGITSFDGGSSSYRTTSTNFVPGSTTVSTWSNGEWLVATRTNVGPMNVRRCDLNFYPPSSDVRSDFWQSTTQGGQIMAQAILWTCGVTNSASVPSAPMGITGTNVVCVGATTSFTIPSVVGATGYTWSVPAGATITSGQGTTTINVSTSSAATSTVSVTADNACGSSTPTTISFTINPLPSVNYSFSPSLSVCSGTTVTLSGTGASAYSWASTVTIMDGVPFTATSSDTYTVTGVDANGCSNTAVASLTVNPLPTVVANSTTPAICAGSSVTLTGSGAAMYSWTGGAIDGVPFAPTITDTYTVTGTDGNGCSGTATVTVAVNGLPIVVANTTSATVCAGGSVTLTGSGASSYTWTGGAMDGVPFAPTITDTYTVTGTDGNGCSNTASVMVTVNALPSVGSNPPSATVCMGGSVTLSGTGATSYMWMPMITDGMPFTPSISDTYTVTGTDANGCSNTSTVAVTVNANPTVTGSSPVSIACLDDGAITLTESPSGGMWTGPGMSGSTFTPMTAGNGTHTLIYSYTDTNSCIGSDTVSIQVDLCLGLADNSTKNYNVYPNPNNGTFTLAINNVAGDVNVELVDLSGRVVYSSTENNVQSGFTTQIVTENLSAGTYMLRVASANEQQIIKIVVE